MKTVDTYVDTYNIKTIYKPEVELIDSGYTIKNDMISYASVKLLGHFGDCASFELYTSMNRIIANYNNNLNLAFLLKGLVEMFDMVEEDGYDFFNKFRVIPCRIVIKDNIIIGFGHFMKDRFVLVEDFVNLGKNKG